MPQPGTILGDLVETVKEQGGKAVKEIASAPIDIVKASFEQPIPNPTAERKQELEAKRKAELAKVRSGIAVLNESKPQQKEDRRIQQGAEKAERGQTNQAAQMNNQGQPLSANQTTKKKMEPPVLTQKRKDRAPAGAG